MRRSWSLLLTLLVACNDGDDGSQQAVCEGYGADPDPCCCYPEPDVLACDELQLCSSIEADCEDGTLGSGACVLDQASDGAVTCALTALADGSEGSIAWSIRESGGARQSSATLHLGGPRAVLQVSTEQDGETTVQVYAGSIPSDFDVDECRGFDTPGARFECMLNATALQDSLTCHDVSLGE